MRRLISLIIIALLLIGSVIAFSGEQSQPQPPAEQAQPRTQQQNQQQSEQDRRTQQQIEQIERNEDASGDYSEIVRASQPYAFFPRRYTSVYLKPVGEGTVARLSVITYRPKQILWQGYLSERGCKFTTLFPVMHFIYVANLGTGGKLAVIYKPHKGTANLSQNKRIKMAWDAAQQDDERHFRALDNWDRERARRRQQRQQQSGQQQQGQQQQGQQQGGQQSSPQPRN